MPNATLSEVQRGSSVTTDNAPCFKWNGPVTGLPFTPGTLAHVDGSGNLTTATANSRSIVGAFRLDSLPAVTGSGEPALVGYGRCAMVCDAVVAAGKPIKAAQLGRVIQAIDLMLTGTTIATGAGVTFTNQPTGDQFEVLSSSASDITQTVTVYYTKTGTTTTILSQTITLTGTTAVASTDTTVQQVFAVTKSAATVGTITVRKKTGAATITTLAPATLSSGLLTISAGSAYNGIPTLVVDAADTANVAILGTGTNDAALSSIIAATGTTKAAFGSTAFKTVTLVMVGAATTARTYTVAVGAEDTQALRIGISHEASTAQGQVIDCFIIPSR